MTIDTTTLNFDDLELQTLSVEMLDNDFSAALGTWGSVSTYASASSFGSCAGTASTAGSASSASG